jgi:hypothetical protein
LACIRGALGSLYYFGESHEFAGTICGKADQPSCRPYRVTQTLIATADHVIE